MSGRTDRGLTLIELTISAAIMISVVAIVLSISGVVGDSLAVNAKASEIAERTRITRRITGFLRSASVTALEVPVGGVWGPPIDSTSYSLLRFRPLVGLPTATSAALGPSRTLAFVMEAGETADGTDEDGDGLVDEGEMQLVEASGSRATLASGVEIFTIVKSGRNLAVTLRIGGRDERRNVHHSTIRVPILLRNN